MIVKLAQSRFLSQPWGLSMNRLISYHDGCSKARNHERSSVCCGTVIEVGPLSDARHTGVPLRPDIESLPQEVPKIWSWTSWTWPELNVDTQKWALQYGRYGHLWKGILKWSFWMMISKGNFQGISGISGIVRCQPFYAIFKQSH